MLESMVMSFYKAESLLQGGSSANLLVYRSVSQSQTLCSDNSQVQFYISPYDKYQLHKNSSSQMTYYFSYFKYLKDFLLT